MRLLVGAGALPNGRRQEALGTQQQAKLYERCRSEARAVHGMAHDVVDAQGRWPLHRACARRSAPWLRWLLAVLPDHRLHVKVPLTLTLTLTLALLPDHRLPVQDNEGLTPFDIAYRNTHPASLAVLCEQPNARGIWPLVPDMLAEQAALALDSRSAASLRRGARMIEVLCAHENEREPALLVASRLLQEEAVRCLLATEGRDPLVVNASGNTALHAVACCHVADINRRRQSHGLPTIAASRLEETKVRLLRWLMGAGVPLESRNSAGCTAADIAEARVAMDDCAANAVVLWALRGMEGPEAAVVAHECQRAQQWGALRLLWVAPPELGGHPQQRPSKALRNEEVVLCRVGPRGEYELGQVVAPAVVPSIERESLPKVRVRAGHAAHASDDAAAVRMSGSMSMQGKIEAIVTALDADGNGMMDDAEAKVFVATLTGTAVDDIPDHHPEVRALPCDVRSTCLWRRRCSS